MLLQIEKKTRFELIYRSCAKTKHSILFDGLWRVTYTVTQTSKQTKLNIPYKALE